MVLQKALILFILLAYLSSAIASCISGIFLGFFGENIVLNMRNVLWTKLMYLKLQYYDKNKSGEIVSRLTNDSTQLKFLLSTSFPQMLLSVIAIIGSIVLLIHMDWKMALVMIVTLPITVLSLFPIMLKFGKIGQQRQDILSTFTGRAAEFLREIRLVKASNGELNAIESVEKETGKLYKIGQKEVILQSALNPLMTTVLMLLVLGLLSFGANRVARGEMTFGVLVSFLMYLFQLVGPIGVVGQFASDVSETLGSTERIRSILDEAEEKFLDGDYVDVLNKGLRMENVCFSYESGKPILKNIFFEAKPNAIIAFVGPSGSGKSTIFNILERFYPPLSGTIFIGDQNIQEINLNHWRKQIGFVGQDVMIFFRHYTR
ncbi:ABC transporter ATP-binding protein [Pseudolactococcus yaeyamensis]